MNKYEPRPIDTSAIKLPPELQPLVEEMARNVHEVWSKSRIEEGWSYGPERDDRLKKHPCLVPYEALPESEREYDRATSQEAIRFILSRGFKISREG